MSTELTPQPPLDRRDQERRGRQDQRRRAQLTEIELRGRQLGEMRFHSDPLGSPDPAVARLVYDDLDVSITADVKAGKTRHNLLSWPVRQVPKVVAVIDCVVLYTFCAVILNVPLDDPLSSPISALAAGFLAILAAGASYLWLALTGNRTRTFRDDFGEVRWSLLGATSWIMIGVSLVLVATLSLLMYDRILAELVDSLDQGQTPIAPSLALAFALISAVANLCVVAVHAFDGSAESELRRTLGRLLLRRQRKIQRWQRRAVKMMGRTEAGADRTGAVSGSGERTGA